MLHQLIRKTILIPLLIVCFSCDSEKQNSSTIIQQSVTQELNYSGEVIRLKGTSFYAYQIKKNGKTVINQSFLPAIQGKLPIEDSLSAVRLMQRSLTKISNGQFPPALSIDEVKNCIGTQN